MRIVYFSGICPAIPIARIGTTGDEHAPIREKCSRVLIAREVEATSQNKLLRMRIVDFCRSGDRLTSTTGNEHTPIVKQRRGVRQVRFVHGGQAFECSR